MVGNCVRFILARPLQTCIIQFQSSTQTDEILRMGFVNRHESSCLRFIAVADIDSSSVVFQTHLKTNKFLSNFAYTFRCIVTSSLNCLKWQTFVSFNGEWVVSVQHVYHAESPDGIDYLVCGDYIEKQYWHPLKHVS